MNNVRVYPNSPNQEPIYKILPQHKLVKYYLCSFSGQYSDFYERHWVDFYMALKSKMYARLMFDYGISDTKKMLPL